MAVDGKDISDFSTQDMSVNVSVPPNIPPVERITKVLDSVGVYGRDVVSQKREEAILTQLEQTTSFFDDFKETWYLVGGLALELSTGHLMRDHSNDFDVAVKKQDVASLLELAESKGLRIVKPLRHQEFAQYHEQLGTAPKVTYEDSKSGAKFVQTSNLEVILSGGNFFILPSEANSSSQLPYDIDILEENEDGSIIFPADKDIVFPSNLYESAPVYVLPSGKVVRLTPPAVQIIHKLFGGRDKELIDITGAWGNISDGEKSTVESYLKKAAVGFSRHDGEKFESVEDLLEAIPLAEVVAAAKTISPHSSGKSSDRGLKHWEIMKEY